jgi:hypothetical protein
MNFYENFNSNKKKYKLNNRVLGEIIEMKPDTLRMAINNKSLTKLEILEIERFFNTIDRNYRIPEISSEFINQLFENEYFKKRLIELVKNNKK